MDCLPQKLQFRWALCFRHFLKKSNFPLVHVFDNFHNYLLYIYIGNYDKNRNNVSQWQKLTKNTYFSFSRLKSEEKSFFFYYGKRP